MNAIEWTAGLLADCVQPILEAAERIVAPAEAVRDPQFVSKRVRVSEADCAYIRAHYPTCEAAVIGAVIGRSAGAVTSIAFRIGAKKMPLRTS